MPACNFQPVERLLFEFFDEYVIVGRVSGCGRVVSLRSSSLSDTQVAFMFAGAMAAMPMAAKTPTKVKRGKK